MAKKNETTKTPAAATQNTAATEKTGDKPAKKRTLPKKPAQAGQAPENGPSVTETSVATVPEPVENTPEAPVETPTPEEKVDVNQEPSAPKAPFKPVCGSTFSSDPNSSCFTMCQEDTPDDFKACLANFRSSIQEKKTTRVERTKTSTEKRERVKREGGTVATKSTKRFDRIGDGYGTSAHMINVLLLEGATIEEMEELIPAAKTRITGHLAGLKSGNTKREPKIIIRDKSTGRYFLELAEGEPTCYFTL